MSQLQTNLTNLQKILNKVNNLPDQEPVEWSLNEDAILTGDITEYTNNRITTLRDGAFSASSLQSINLPICESIGEWAFRYNADLTTVNIPFCKRIGWEAFQFCDKLQSIDLPNCIRLDSGSFADCPNLQSINLPVCEYIGAGSFAMSISLTSIDLPACQYIEMRAFDRCPNLQSINLPVCEYIGQSAFQYCPNLKSVYLPGPNLCELSDSNAFIIVNNGSVVQYPPDIYVPASLVEAYKSAPEWSDLKDYIKAIITFSIEDNDFEAIEGMTWQEWINSKYNIEKTWNTPTGTFTAKIVSITADNSPQVKDQEEEAYGIVSNKESDHVKRLTDIIINHQQYFLTYGGFES